MSKVVAHSYSLLVYSRKYDGYIDWGKSYDNKEECLNHMKKYLQDCLSIWNKYKDDKEQAQYAKYYLEQYEDYTQHPITLIDKKYVTELFTTTKQINILED